MALAFQQQIIRDLSQEDGLVIMAKGLDVEGLLYYFIKLNASPNRLVFVLNLSAQALERVNARLSRDHPDGQPSTYMPVACVTNEVPAPKRAIVFAAGGVIAITTRILAVDMLNALVPLDLVSGMLVNHAERCDDASSEAFVLRIFRKANRVGFIKAFSEDAEQFTQGFFKIEKILKCLLVRKLFLYPRFHALVKQDLSGSVAEVVEVPIPLSRTMTEMQKAIVDVLNACLVELKQEEPSLRASNLINLEDGLLKSFDLSIRRELDPRWHEISSKTKALVSDLTIIRRLASHLFFYDCVQFYRYLMAVKAEASKHHSLWLCTDAATHLFKLAQQRVYKFHLGKMPLPSCMQPVQREDMDAIDLEWFPTGDEIGIAAAGGIANSESERVTQGAADNVAAGTGRSSSRKRSAATEEASTSATLGRGVKKVKREARSVKEEVAAPDRIEMVLESNGKMETMVNVLTEVDQLVSSVLGKGSSARDAISIDWTDEDE